MDIIRDDLFIKDKYFLGIFAVLVAVGVIVYFVNFNSVEAKCRRYVQRLGPMPKGGDNKLLELQVKTAWEYSIRSCIKRGGP